jgi:hypothetical protein
MTEFCFDHVFRASSTAAVFAAYFDPDHVAEQDHRLDVVERAVLERTETADELVRVSRVVPRRQLPALIRPLVPGQLHYVESARWRKRDDEIELEIRPSILSGRASVTARYRLHRAGTEAIHRRYEGTVSVDVALFSSRIERGIVAELERSLPLAAACTQGWLDRAPAAASLSSRP